MLKKTLLLSAAYIAIIPFTLAFAAEEATLKLVNQTIVPEGWASVGHVFVMGKHNGVCSIGYDPKCQTTVSVKVPANEIVNIKTEWHFGNSGKRIDESCRRQIMFKPKETKTFTMRGVPSNVLDYQTVIFCNLS